MTFNTLPLSYCTNVHPGRNMEEVRHGLTTYTAKLQEGYGEPLAAGLWLAAPVIAELQSSPDELSRLRELLNEQQLNCYTLNAFPYGDFHSERVKENVYIPDWTTPERFQYTLDCAQVLTNLLGETHEGSISTVPLGFKGFDHPHSFQETCADQLIRLAQELSQLHSETGKRVRLAIEPEPLCVLETTVETIAFFDLLRDRAADQNSLDVVQDYLGVCYDVCHQSVEFEDVARSIADLTAADIRINKVHITCAIQLPNPAENVEGREALARYVEPRYLHQTMARKTDGEVLRFLDLTKAHAQNPPADFLNAELWRIHFHVPVNAESLGPLETTREDLKRALAAVKQLDYAPHLEVETYTWEVLPENGEGGPSVNLVEGFTRELTATRALLDET